MPEEKKQPIIKRPPIIALQVRTVPDYLELYNLVKNREYWDAKRNGEETIEAKDPITALREMEDSMRVDSSGKPSFLPIPFQKIVATSLIITNGEGKTTINAFTGDELSVIANTWQKILENYPNPKKPEFNSFYPIIVTNDRKKASLPLLLSRSLSMYTRHTEEICYARKMDKRSLTPTIRERASLTIKKPKEERTEEDNMYYSLEKAASGWRHIMDNEDKWENRKPNYTNPYSKYQPDTVYDFHTQGSDLYDAELTDSLVASNSWEELAEYSTAKLLDSYKSFLVSRYLRNAEPLPETVMALTPQDITIEDGKSKVVQYKFKEPEYNPSIPAEAIKYYNKQHGIETEEKVLSLRDAGL